SFRAPLDGYTLPMFGGVVMRIHSFGGAHLAIAVGLFAATGSGQQPAPVGYDDTPMQPNGKWRIHDANRPPPTVVTAPPALATAFGRDGVDRHERRSRRLADGGRIAGDVADEERRRGNRQGHHPHQG